MTAAIIVPALINNSAMPSEPAPVFTEWYQGYVSRFVLESNKIPDEGNCLSEDDVTADWSKSLVASPE